MEQPAKSGPEEDRPRAKPEPSKAEDASRPATKSSAYTAAPLSSRMLAVVIVVGVILPIVYLGWLAVEKSQDKNTTGDSFGALMALVVIASLLWSRLKFGLRVRTMTTEQIRGEVKQGQSESRRRLHLLRRSPLAMVGLIIVAFIVSLSVLAPVLYSLGVIEHWDPNKAENPTAQGYFQLLPPSTEAGAQYDLYVTQTHITGPLSGPVSGFGARTLGKGNVTVTGDFFIPLPGSAVVNVSDVKTSLDRVEILAPDTKVQAGGRMELQARA
ncbi:MAG TPA: hypothetical protein VI893_00275, partial [Thermoplasmata archaeon]|nr:hypothetical protein [Thermoplasmata archaeon]